MLVSVKTVLRRWVDLENAPHNQGKDQRVQPDESYDSQATGAGLPQALQRASDAGVALDGYHRHIDKDDGDVVDFSDPACVGQLSTLCGPRAGRQTKDWQRPGDSAEKQLGGRQMEHKEQRRFCPHSALAAQHHHTDRDVGSNAE